MDGFLLFLEISRIDIHFPVQNSYCTELVCFSQLEIPRQLFDPNVFNDWMILFLNVLERPVSTDGQPVDPELRKSWGWWKVKKWTVHILNRIYTRLYT